MKWYLSWKAVQMKFLIPFLLLFGIECCYGRTLPRKELLKNVNVYSIHENDHNALTIVNPKSKKPTMKEIIYFHVIERPYEDSQVMVTHKEETVQCPDFDETRRPFTNGHGLQFSDLNSEIDEDAETSNETIDLDKENTQSSDEDLTTVERSSEAEDDIESNDDNTESSDDDSESDDEDNEHYDVSGETSGDEGQEEEEHDTANRDDEDVNTNNRMSKPPPKTNSSKEKVVSINRKGHNINEVAETAEKSSTTKLTVRTMKPQTSETTTKAVIVTTKPTVVNEKRAARNMLFNQLRERYQKSLKPISVTSRSKRYTEYNDLQDDAADKELPIIPEAPILPELNFNELPSYIRHIISSTEKWETPKLEKNNDNMEGEIEHRIEEIINEVMRPYEEDGDRKELQEDTHNKPKTYGMKLNRGTGYVWNDFWSNPGMSFGVEDSPNYSSDEELEVNQEYDIEPYEKDTYYEEMHHESSEIYDSRPDLDDIFVNKHKENNEDKPTDEKEKYRENAINYKSKVKSEPNINNSKLVHKERHDDSNLLIKKASEILIENSMQKDTTEKSTTDITKSYDKDREPLEKEKEHVTQKEKTLNDPESYQPKRIGNIIEILKDQDEDFWTWLQDWTSTYMDLLMKHIKKIVQQEVKEQLKLNNNKHYDHKNSSKQPETFREPQKDKTGIENSQVPVTDNSITVDGVTIPLTHNTNFHLNHTANDIERDEINNESESKSLKGRKHKEKYRNTTVEDSNVESESDSKIINIFNETDKKSMKRGQVDAKNIFGNSYNNDKVTNIYIFYPNSDLKKVIKDSNLDTVNNITTFILEKPERISVKEKESITTGGKNEESKPFQEEIVPIIDKKDEMTTQITPTKENKLSQTFTESITSQSDEAKVETDIINTTKNDHNAVNSEVVGEKNDTSVINESEVLKLGIQTVGYFV